MPFRMRCSLSIPISRFVFANTEATRFLDRARHYRSTAADLFAAVKVCRSGNTEDTDARQLAVARALRGETVDCVEYLVRPTPQRNRFWIECGARPLAAGRETFAAQF